MTRCWQSITIAFIAGMAVGIAVMAPDDDDRPKVSRWDQSMTLPLEPVAVGIRRGR